MWVFPYPQVGQVLVVSLGGAEGRGQKRAPYGSVSYNTRPNVSGYIVMNTILKHIHLRHSSNMVLNIPSKFIYIIQTCNIIPISKRKESYE